MKLEDFKEFELNSSIHVKGGEKGTVTQSCMDSDGMTSFETDTPPYEAYPIMDEFDSYDSSKGDPYLGTKM